MSNKSNSPTKVLKRWMEEGYNVGWPKKEGCESSEEANYNPLECHGCGNHVRTLRNLMWYDTGDDGTQLCRKCDSIFYEEYINQSKT